MKQDFRVADDRVMVSLSGSMYVEEAAVLRERLLEYAEKGHKRFFIDMSCLDYIDSSGLGVLVAIHKRAVQKGGEVALHGLRGVVKELFELTRLTKVFTIS